MSFKKYQDNKRRSCCLDTYVNPRKKTSKGTPFAIAKFSDKSEEFELFLFSELLIKNRDILKEGESL